MRFSVKNLKISTGDTLVAILNKKDADKYGLFSMDRLKISNGSHKSITAVIDITESEELVPKGTMGVFQELYHILNLRGVKKVNVEIEKKPDSIHYIKDKLSKKRLGYEQFKQIIQDIIDNKLTSIEMTYFVTACYVNELSTKEIYNLTKAMIDTGEMIDFDKRIIMDKHCIGGVAGNRTTMVATAIIAAVGYTIPKTSSRSITSAAGTADTMEQLCKVGFSPNELKRIVEKTSGCIVWGGALNLAPADDKIIGVESPISLDPVGQLIASVLAKKKSVSATHLLIDIPWGKGAKIIDKKSAKALKRKFQTIAKMIKIKTKVILSDGTHPIGNGIGPVLEARDVLYTLKNDIWGSFELKEKSISLAGEMLKMVGHHNGADIARKIFDSGAAYEKFVEIVKAQGGKETDPDKMRLGKYFFDIHAEEKGKVSHIDNKAINKIARVAGAPVDPRAGVYLYIYKGKPVHAQDKLFRIYSESKERLSFAKEHTKRFLGVEISDK
ncbi:AMP phosphorylase [Candidatus Woesearchaeota archaeon]|nr:AMP phosphorylase [Candidatus Woesearchaeota archaeon]